MKNQSKSYIICPILSSVNGKITESFFGFSDVKELEDSVLWIRYIK